jgi:CheY-like chemotaxis protein
MKMQEFSLRDVCNNLLTDLKTSFGSQNIVNLQVDMKLQDQFEGQSSKFTDPIKSMVNFLAHNLINGIILIEINQTSQTGNQVGVQVNVTGSGVSELTSSPTYKSPSQLIKEFQTSVQAASPKTEFQLEGNKIFLVFTTNLKYTSGDATNIEHSLKSKKILLAEDNEVNVIVFCNFLDDWGTSYTVAGNGKEALDLLRKNTYDAVLMDIHMPVMDGIEAIRELRKFNPTIPVIVLSAATFQKDIKLAFDAGANEYLKKPVSSWELYSTITKFF